MDPKEVTFPDTLRLSVVPPDRARTDAIDAAEAVASGDDTVAVRTFADVTDLRRLLTNRRVEAVQAIMDGNPPSIQALADQLERNYPDIYEDLELLAEYGIVYFREAGRAKAPYIPYKRIEIQGTIAEATHS